MIRLMKKNLLWSGINEPTGYLPADALGIKAPFDV